MPLPPPIQHCRRCGTRVEHRVPPDDQRERAVCPACGYIDYVNPLVVVGTLPVLDDGRILLCLRNIEPRKGYWTLPAGFLELGETAADGALRETVEEAGARAEILGLYTAIDVLRAGQIHLFYRARLLDETLDPGHETIEARFFRPDEIPWSELAFATVRATLEQHLRDHGLPLPPPPAPGSMPRPRAVYDAVPVHRLHFG